MTGTPAHTAKQIYNLYCDNKEAALAEVFCMAKAYHNKQGDMPNTYWRDVFIELQKI